MPSLIAASASGVLYSLLFAPHGISALAWVALVPLALALRSCSLPRAVAVAGLATWVGTACIIPWVAITLHDHFEKGWAFSLGFWLLFSATALSPYYAPLLAAQAWAARRLPRAWAPLLFAAAWVGAEWLRVQLGFRSPWTRLGDALVGATVLRQVADLFGVYGLSFLVALANAVVAEALFFVSIAWRHPRGRGADWRPLAIGATGFAALLALALGYGEARLRALPQGETDFEVAIVQGNLDSGVRWSRSRAGHVLRRYGGLTRDLVVADPEAPPDLIVWPENAIQTSVHDPVYGPPLVRLAARAPLLIGAPRSERVSGGRRSFNSACLIDERGVVATYDKRRLLPFSETRPFGDRVGFGSRGDLDAEVYTAGRSAALFEVGGIWLAPLICMEALYPELAAESALAGADAVVNLSNDGWFAYGGGTEQHFAMVVFRAIETRRPVIRATTSGVSAVIAPDGRTLARLEQGERGFARAKLPAAPRALSLYTRIGDVFAVACALLCAAAVAVAGARRAAAHARIGVDPSSPPRSSA